MSVVATADELTVHGLKLVAGKTEFTVPGIGRLRFHSVAVSDTGDTWVTGWHVKRSQWRAVDPALITTVHRTVTARPPVELPRARRKRARR